MYVLGQHATRGYTLSRGHWGLWHMCAHVRVSVLYLHVPYTIVLYVGTVHARSLFPVVS